MKYLQYIQYFYLIASVLFAIEGINSILEHGDNIILYFLLSGAALFMFFFRRRFKKRFDQTK